MSIEQSNEDDGFDVNAIINGTALININGRTYPVCVNTNMKEILKTEETCSEKPVTELFRKKWQYMQSQKASKLYYNIHFIYRKDDGANDGFAIDIRPTGRIR